MLAPVLVSVYNRKQSLLDCIFHLKKCSLAKETELFIVSDAGIKEEDKIIIKSIREELQRIEGFKKINIIEREQNLGSYISINSAINEILLKYKKIIFLEDDIRVSPYFLEYMNICLEKFKDQKDIFSISGYMFPIKKIEKNLNKDIFLWKRYCPWGMGTWLDRWEEIDFELKNGKKFLSNKKRKREYKQIEPNSYILLEKNIQNEIVTADTRICYHMFLKEMYTIYPRKTLTVNRGHNGSGEHCRKEKKYYFQELDTTFLPVIEEKKMLLQQDYIDRIMYKYHYSIVNEIIKPFLKKIYLFNILKKIMRGK